MNSDNFIVLVSGDRRRCRVNMCAVRPLHSKWVSKKSQKSASDFVLSLNIPLWKRFRWFRWRPQLWARGDWQLHQDTVPVHAPCLVQSFLAKHQIIQVTQPPCSPDLVPHDFWFFSKLKSPLKGRFQTIDEIQENAMGQLVAIGRTVWGLKVPTLKGLRHHVYSVPYLLYLLQ